MLAITGTADDKTQSVIINQLVLKRPHKFYVSPNRNLGNQVQKGGHVPAFSVACQHGERKGNCYPKMHHIL